MNEHMKCEVPGEQFTILIVQKHSKINNSQMEKNPRMKMI